MNGERKRKQKQPLADQLSELCMDLNPNHHKWTAEQNARFSALYSTLSEIDERKSCNS